MLATTGAGAESLLRGIAALLWPGVVLVSVLVFKHELRNVLRRIRKGKLLGQEIELDESLNNLAQGAEALAAASIPPLEPNQPGTGESSSTLELVEREESEVAQILAIAATSPRAALMQLAATLEREGRRLLAATGHSAEVGRNASLPRIADALERATTMPRGSLDVFRTFYNIRNQIVHGQGEVADDEILRAIDSGIVLLRALNAVPRERNVIYHPGADVFADEAGNQRLPGVGVILETTSPGGAITTHRIYPTMRTHFRKGMEVAWEWSGENVWGEAWYRDPDTGELKSAWGSSMEFIGRDLRET